MGKLFDLGAFDHGQIVGVRRMSHSIFEIVRMLGFSRSTVSRVYQECMDSGQKKSRSGKLQRAISLDRLLRRIVRSQRSQMLAQITTQMNASASCTVSKWTVKLSLHRMCFGSHWPTRVPLLNALYQASRLAWERELRDWSVEDWK
ncbi:HTH_Tnp_Tc3_2 domain-containing protein [Trichonephila clavipes]|nr:HTH_Tnp_Tc3_2 domain-containing protein [Trichonephila clavipes]